MTVPSRYEKPQDTDYDTALRFDLKKCLLENHTIYCICINNKTFTGLLILHPITGYHNSVQMSLTSTVEGMRA